MLTLDLRHSFGPGKFVQAFIGCPCERRSVLDRRLLVALGFFKSIWVLTHQADPFDLLLVETERAAAARAPAVVVRKTQTGVLQQSDDRCFVEPGFSEREVDVHVGVRGDHT